jgi:hypothetical protein
MTTRLVSLTSRRALAALGVAVVTLLAPAVHAQAAYPTPEAAVDAFIDALARHDWDEMRTVLGKDYLKYVPDPVNDDDITDFLAAQAKSRRIKSEGPERARLVVGPNDWVLPLPLVRTPQGWRFDMVAGREEMLTRRIGRNELDAAQALLAYFDAQKEYATVDHNGDGVLEYAQRIMSTPGKRDGLSWGDGSDSPLGPQFGNDLKDGAYHGYYFRVLKAQGPAARGGARDYMLNGRMKRGFAAIAWPARWGDTGIVTFIVNHDGRIYQKNLGPRTDAIARSIKTYDPDSSWSRVPVRGLTAQK